MNARAVALGLGLWWPGVAAAGWTPDIKLDHFGYRPADRKIALLTTSATGGVVEVRRAADGSLAYAVPSASLTGPFNDAGGDSGDTVITRADFTDLTAPGDYYLRVPAWGATSYVFSIGAGVYNNAAAALLKAFFAQRCGTGKPASAMGVWADPGACHVANDSACAHFGGEPGTNYGSLDLTGGWHDAGDHNKYIGGHAGYGGDDGGGIFGITAGFELNATAFNSDQTSLLPGESGNGVPDCLDEARWHAEWYRKMQRPDGSVLSLVHTNGFGGGGTPSGDLVTRYYYDATVDSTSIAGACFARLARLLQPYQPGWAATYEAAANAAWGWLPVVNTDTKLWLAAELYRLNPGGANAAPAQSYVDAYRNWGNGAGAQAWAEGGNLDSKS